MIPEHVHPKTRLGPGHLGTMDTRVGTIGEVSVSHVHAHVANRSVLFATNWALKVLT